MNTLPETGRLEHLLVDLRDIIRAWNEPQPEFSFDLGWSSDYDRLFKGDFENTSGIDEIVNYALAGWRVLLSGRGGAAKTTIVFRLLKRLIEPTVFPILISLKEWREPLYAEWSKFSDDPLGRVDLLFRNLASPKVNVLLLDGIPPIVKRLVWIDGLNEIRADYANQMIATVDDYLRTTLNTSVIVTDRIVRRSFVDPRLWKLCMLLPLSFQEVRKQLSVFPTKGDAFEHADKREQALLQNPLFLDQFLKGSKSLSGTLLTTASELRYYFTEQLRLNSDEVGRAAHAAFTVYEEQKTRTF